MKKYLFISFLSLLPLLSFGQGYQSSHGIRVGIGRSTLIGLDKGRDSGILTATNIRTTRYGTGYRSAYELGYTYQLTHNGKSFFQLDLFANLAGAKLSNLNVLGDEKNYLGKIKRVNYFSLAVLKLNYGYKWGQSGKNIFISGGLYFTLNPWKEEVDCDYSEIYSFDRYDENLFDFGLNTYDIGLNTYTLGISPTIGVEYKRVQLSLSYERELTKLLKSKNGVYNSAFKLSLVYFVKISN